ADRRAETLHARAIRDDSPGSAGAADAGSEAARRRCRWRLERAGIHPGMALLPCGQRLAVFVQGFGVEVVDADRAAALAAFGRQRLLGGLRRRIVVRRRNRAWEHRASVAHRLPMTAAARSHRVAGAVRLFRFGPAIA